MAQVISNKNVTQVRHNFWAQVCPFCSTTISLVQTLQSKILEQLDNFCPEKTVKISSQDKPWITAELKKISRQKSREYQKRGKTYNAIVQLLCCGEPSIEEKEIVDAQIILSAGDQILKLLSLLTNSS